MTKFDDFLLNEKILINIYNNRNRINYLKTISKIMQFPPAVIYRNLCGLKNAGFLEFKKEGRIQRINLTEKGIKQVKEILKNAD